MKRNKHIEWWDNLPKYKKTKISEDEYWISFKDMEDWQIKKVYLKYNEY